MVLGAPCWLLGMRCKYALIADGTPVAFESAHKHTTSEQTQFNATNTYLHIFTVCICVRVCNLHLFSIHLSGVK